MIQILFRIWTCNLKQSGRVFCGEHFFFLPQILKNFEKPSKFTFKLFWEKEIQKKGKGAGAAGPTRLPFGPLARAAQLLPSSLRTGASRPSPPDTGHVAVVRRRRGRLAPTGMTRSGRHPSTPSAPILCVSPSFAHSRSRSKLRRGAIAGQAPPLDAGRFNGPSSAPSPPPCSPSPW